MYTLAYREAMRRKQWRKVRECGPRYSKVAKRNVRNLVRRRKRVIAKGYSLHTFHRLVDLCLSFCSSERDIGLVLTKKSLHSIMQRDIWWRGG